MPNVINRNMLIGQSATCSTRSLSAVPRRGNGYKSGNATSAKPQKARTQYRVQISRRGIEHVVRIAAEYASGAKVGRPRTGEIVSLYEWLASPEGKDFRQKLPELWSATHALSSVSPACAVHAVRALHAWVRDDPTAKPDSLTMLRSILTCSIDAANAQRHDLQTGVTVRMKSGPQVEIPLKILPKRWGDVLEEAAKTAAAVSGSGDAALAVIRGALRTGVWPVESVIRGTAAGLQLTQRGEDADRVRGAATVLGQDAAIGSPQSEHTTLGQHQAYVDEGSRRSMPRPIYVLPELWNELGPVHRVLVASLHSSNPSLAKAWALTATAALNSQDDSFTGFLEKQISVSSSGALDSSVMRVGQSRMPQQVSTEVDASQSPHGIPSPTQTACSSSAATLLQQLDANIRGDTTILNNRSMRATSGRAPASSTLAGDFSIAEALLSDHNRLRNGFQALLNLAAASWTSELPHAVRQLLRLGASPDSGSGIVSPQSRRRILEASGDHDASSWALVAKGAVAASKWGSEPGAMKQDPLPSEDSSRDELVVSATGALMQAAVAFLREPAERGVSKQRASIASAVLPEIRNALSWRMQAWQRVKWRSAGSYLLDTASKQGGTDYRTRGVGAAAVARRLGAHGVVDAGQQKASHRNDTMVSATVNRISSLGLHGGMLVGESLHGPESIETTAEHTDTDLIEHPFSTLDGVPVPNELFRPLFLSAAVAGANLAMLELAVAAQNGSVEEAELRRTRSELLSSSSTGTANSIIAALAMLAGAPAFRGRGLSPLQEVSVARIVRRDWQRLAARGCPECTVAGLGSESSVGNDNSVSIREALDVLANFMSSPSPAVASVQTGSASSGPSAKEAAAAVQLIRQASIADETRNGSSKECRCYLDPWSADPGANRKSETSSVSPSASLGVMQAIASSERSERRLTDYQSDHVAESRSLTDTNAADVLSDVCWGAFADLFSGVLRSGAQAGPSNEEGGVPTPVYSRAKNLGGCYQEASVLLEYACGRIDSAVARAGGTVKAAHSLGLSAEAVYTGGRGRGAIPAMGEDLRADMQVDNTRIFFAPQSRKNSSGGCRDKDKARLLPLSVAALQAANRCAGGAGQALDTPWKRSMSQRAVMLALGTQNASEYLASAALSGDIAEVWQLLLLEGRPRGGILPQLPMVLAAVRGWKQQQDALAGRV